MKCSVQCNKVLTILKLDILLCFHIIIGVRTVDTTLFVVVITTRFIPRGSYQAKYLLKHIKGWYIPLACVFVRVCIRVFGLM